MKLTDACPNGLHRRQLSFRGGELGTLDVPCNLCGCCACRGLQYLDFVLPGRHDVCLVRADGSHYPEDVGVTLDTLGEYVEAVVRTMLVVTVGPQVRAFCDGFNEYGCVAGLQLFSAAELASLLSAGTDTLDHLWHPRSVAKHIVCQHGYTTQSVQVGCHTLAVLGKGHGYRACGSRLCAQFSILSSSELR